MSERLKGSFMGCPYHDDDYEACIQHSGQAPCDVTKQQKEDWQAEAVEALAAAGRTWSRMELTMAAKALRGTMWRA